MFLFLPFDFRHRSFNFFPDAYSSPNASVNLAANTPGDVRPQFTLMLELIMFFVAVPTKLLVPD